MCLIGTTSPKFVKVKLDELATHIKEYNQVMVAYIDPKSEQGATAYKTLFKISKQPEQ